MISAESQQIIQQGKKLYDLRYRQEMERDHPGQFLCIEPVSGRYWLGATFDEAVNAAMDDAPGCMTYTLQIGHLAPLHVGAWSL